MEMHNPRRFYKNKRRNGRGASQVCTLEISSIDACCQPSAIMIKAV
jgi:hypothetical protein